MIQPNLQNSATRNVLPLTGQGCLWTKIWIYAAKSSIMTEIAKFSSAKFSRYTVYSILTMYDNVSWLICMVANYPEPDCREHSWEAWRAALLAGNQRLPSQLFQAKMDKPYTVVIVVGTHVAYWCLDDWLPIAIYLPPVQTLVVS